MKILVKTTLFLTMLSMTACESEKETKKVNQNAFEQPFKTLLVYPKQKLLGAFQLKQDNQSDFTLENFRGKWHLIFMGFAQCPDVCPTTLSDISAIYRELSDTAKGQIQVVFLSVDPQRDTLEYLNRYVKHFDPGFIGITGQKEQIDLLVGDLGGIYSINNDADNTERNNYTVDHTARIFIVSPDATRYGIISSEFFQSQDKSLLIKDLQKMALSLVN